MSKNERISEISFISFNDFCRFIYDIFLLIHFSFENFVEKKNEVYMDLMKRKMMMLIMVIMVIIIVIVKKKITKIW
jgi:hypothetical protein